MDSSSYRKMSSSSSSTKGVQKLYTKIRHKFEDIPPKITAKLNKTPRSSNSVSVQQNKPTAAPRTKRQSQQAKDQLKREMELSRTKSSVIVKQSPPYENIRISCNPNGSLDSDEECRMSLNDSNLSLEDEIFEELEKVSHDEAKLNAVLKNFDKILSDYNERSLITISTEKSESIQEVKKTNEASLPRKKSEIGHKPLKKSKTCSIIESRCILKKSISNPIGNDDYLGLQPMSCDFQHYSAFQLTKSLWNLKDFETFAKSGKKLEKFDCKLPVMKTTFNQYKMIKPTTINVQSVKKVSSPKQINKVAPLIQSSSSPPVTTRAKSQLPRAKSVWDISSTSLSTTSLNYTNQHQICHRTSSGSKIPVKKLTPQKLSASGRSNSFCDQTVSRKFSTYSPPSAGKIIQVGKVHPTPKRTITNTTTVSPSSPPSAGKMNGNSVHRIIRNLNELSKQKSSTKHYGPPSFSRASSALSSSSTNINSINNNHNYNKKRLISSASSTPHSLHKIGITSRTPSTTHLSTTSSVSSTRLSIKSGHSELALNNIRRSSLSSPSTVSTITTNKAINLHRRQKSDVLLNKCLEKGQEILRKVEAFGNVTKLDNPNRRLSGTLSSSSTDITESKGNNNNFISKNPIKRDIILTVPFSKQPNKSNRSELLRDDNVIANNNNNNNNKLKPPLSTTLSSSSSASSSSSSSYASCSSKPSNHSRKSSITTETDFKEAIKGSNKKNYTLVIVNKKSNGTSSTTVRQQNLNSLNGKHQLQPQQQQQQKQQQPNDKTFKSHITKIAANVTSVDSVDNITSKPKVISKRQDTEMKLSSSSSSSFSSATSLLSSPSSSSLSSSCSLNGQEIKSPLPSSIVYGQEEGIAVRLHRTENRKIFLGEDTKQAELLINVKAIQSQQQQQQQKQEQQPPEQLEATRIHSCEIGQNEKEYHSDCSDDSGHISNENDELPATTNNFLISSSSLGTGTKPIKGTKISELLEKFEPLTRDSGIDVSSSSNTNMNGSTTGITCKVIGSGISGFTSSSSSSSSPPTSSSASSINSLSKKLCTTVKVAEIKNCNSIKSTMEIYPTYSSEVLFRSGVLSQLEAKRDELLSDRIVQLQAYCRGYLARRRVAQRRVQELAVRCIQRNVKAFLAVRDWPWWRLLVRVTPLLNVHRTEEQLKIANDELNMLKSKLEKIENDRNALKTENDKLEAKLSEMTVDLAEERSASNMAGERLEAETGERLKLEKELQDQQSKVKNLQEISEKLEMELICAKSDLNGISEDEDPDNDEGGGVYKLKYERVARELEFTKRRLQTQHEHDLEQLVGLKKQLEKKLADAYEEVEEQRQVVGQWKRKSQKMTNEMNDLRMLLEEQNGRNNLLEKKQRKFDSECQSLQDASRQERQAKDRLSREKDILIAEKFTLEQNLADTRLELELKEEKLSALQRELEEMTFGVGTEEEVAQLRRSKNELERRLKEQEEELDEMAGQVQLLEQAKLRLEMTLETMRKEARREAQQRDDELEEARGSAFKKLRALECQLENEHEERTLLLREKHELERRLQSMEDQDRVDRQAEEAASQKLRRDLRKYKALLKDAYAQLERAKAESPGKALIRQLRNQLEDAEASRTIAVKARQSADAELADVQAMLEEVQRARSDAEDKAQAAQRDRTELQAQIEENEEEMSELMKKYSTTVKQLNNEHMAMSENEIRISELEAERNSLKEHVAELQARLENIENMSDPSAAVQSKRLELRAKELESRLELEQATRARLEIQTTRHKDALEKLQNEISQYKGRDMQAQDALKKAQKNLRELREEFHTVSNREQECIARRKDIEKKVETAESETLSLRNDLRLALQRIADLQQAMEEGDDDVTESDESESTEGSLSDLEQRLRPIQPKRMSTTASNDTNGLGDTTLVIREKKSENSPRITVTSPSTASIVDKTTLKNGDSSYA